MRKISCMDLPKKCPAKINYGSLCISLSSRYEYSKIICEYRNNLVIFKDTVYVYCSYKKTLLDKLDKLEEVFSD